MNQRIGKVYQLGQSFWIDLLHREMIKSGKLSELISEGIVGATSNPDSFAHGITATDCYDDQIEDLKRRGVSARRAYDELVIRDIREAADLFRPVFEESEGGDGYVSLEVSPKLAFEMEKTVAEAKRLVALVNRPNLMIKVPGTPEGMAAVEDLTAEGVNVNVTLLFSFDLYEEAARAYMRGLTRLAALAPGKVPAVASVASFFLSRFDVLIDPKLERIIEAGGDPARSEEARSLLGRAGVAAGKQAYRHFKRIFAPGGEFAALRQKDARVQRPLWASTRTKNPAYPDVLYLQNLIAPATVNTLALSTIEAFKDHGEPRITIDEGGDEAERVFARLEGVGISIKEVTETLLETGVKKFSASFERSLDLLRQRLA
jgi:transaldolase